MCVCENTLNSPLNYEIPLVLVKKPRSQKVRKYPFFRPRGRFVAFPNQSWLVVGDIRKNGQNFSDLNFHKI